MNEGEQPDVGWHKLVPVAVTNAILLGVLAAAGYPALYLLWVVAWLTTYRLVTRIRSIAEHGMVPDRLDPLRNTRTTLASGWERLLVAPNRVNFHLEHHLLMTVPHHNLPALHRLLRERRAIDESCLTPGYVEVVRLATARPSARTRQGRRARRPRTLAERLADLGVLGGLTLRPALPSRRDRTSRRAPPAVRPVRRRAGPRAGATPSCPRAGPAKFMRASLPRPSTSCTGTMAVSATEAIARRMRCATTSCDERRPR